jgi:hypothetical protein
VVNLPFLGEAAQSSTEERFTGDVAVASGPERIAFPG